MRGIITAGLPAGALVAALLSPLPAIAAESPGAAEMATGWLTAQTERGAMPGPTGRADWGVSVDALLAVYASGVGETGARRIESAIESHAGEFLGPDLYRDRDVRLGGSAAALLTAAVVTGNDPTSFGHGRYRRGKATYDPRAEVLDLIAPPGSGQPGRIRDRGTGSDSTNMFSQSLAVIGLARSGGGHREALDFLLTQQCGAGYFRMFYNDQKSCDRAGGKPDIDGTAIAVEALATAQAHGTEGLARPLARAKRWLLRIQRGDGSFGGVGSTDPPNANSTGLAARALHTLGATGAYRKARAWVRGLQLGPRMVPAGAGAEIGAIAYNPTALQQAKRSGIESARRDQWRRATTQAIYAFAPTSLARLGAKQPQGEPRRPEPRTPPDREPDNDNGDRGSDEPRDEPDRESDNDDRTTPRQRGEDTDPRTTADDDEESPRPEQQPKQESEESGDNGSETKSPPRPSSPSERLAAYIAEQLVDGDHIEVREGGESYVDYDTTADAALALRILGERSDAARAATAFLLEKKAVAAYARGRPYETGDVAYAEPLAKLSLLAQWMPADVRGSASSFADQLATLQNASGEFDDNGNRPDRSRSTRRQALAAIALRAAGRDGAADDAVAALRDVQCADGSFGADLSQSDCTTGDLTATGHAVQALSAVRDGDRVSGTGMVDAGAPSVDPQPLRRAANYLYGYGADPAMVPAATGGTDWQAMAALAAGKQAVGLDATYLADRLGQQLHRSGGVRTAQKPMLAQSIQAAPAVAGRSLLSADGSPLSPVAGVPTRSAEPKRSAAPAPREELPVPAWMLYTLAALLAVVLLLAAVLLLLRIRQVSRA